MGTIYGIANQTGKPDAGAVAAILAMARDAGINMLDTASSYGHSEEALGRAGVSDWKIVTKVTLMSGLPSAQISSVIHNSVARSLDLLRCDQLYGVMMHVANDLVGPDGERVSEALQDLESKGLCERTGLSFYRPEDLNGLPKSFKATIAQAPLNPLDQRIVRTRVAQSLTKKGCEVHARSLFLQGLLLMPASARPKKFGRWTKELQACDLVLADDPIAKCLGFAAAQSNIARLIVGVENEAQLSEIISATDRAHDPIGTFELSNEDPELIEPRLWGKYDN